jgi:hypothetical protein
MVTVYLDDKFRTDLIGHLKLFLSYFLLNTNKLFHEIKLLDLVMYDKSELLNNEMTSDYKYVIYDDILEKKHYFYENTLMLLKDDPNCIGLLIKDGKALILDFDNVLYKTGSNRSFEIREYNEKYHKKTMGKFYLDKLWSTDIIVNESSKIIENISYFIKKQINFLNNDEYTYNNNDHNRLIYIYDNRKSFLLDQKIYVDILNYFVDFFVFFYKMLPNSENKIDIMEKIYSVTNYISSDNKKFDIKQRNFLLKKNEKKKSSANNDITKLSVDIKEKNEEKIKKNREYEEEKKEQEKKEQEKKEQEKKEQEKKEQEKKEQEKKEQEKKEQEEIITQLEKTKSSKTKRGRNVYQINSYKYSILNQIRIKEGIDGDNNEILNSISRVRNSTTYGEEQEAIKPLDQLNKHNEYYGKIEKLIKEIKKKIDDASYTNKSVKEEFEDEFPSDKYADQIKNSESLVKYYEYLEKTNESLDKNTKEIIIQPDEKGKDQIKVKYSKKSYDDLEKQQKKYDKKEKIESRITRISEESDIIQETPKKKKIKK